MLKPFFPASKTIEQPPMKNRFAPEQTEHGKNRCEYIYCPIAGSNAAIVIARRNSLRS